MYFIEKIIKLFHNKNKKEKYSPQEIEECTHVFLPIDSSCEYLACSKCGKLIKNQTIRE